MWPTKSLTYCAKKILEVCGTFERKVFTDVIVTFDPRRKGCWYQPTRLWPCVDRNVGDICVFLQEAAKLHSCGVILCSCGQERLIRCRVPDQACQDRQDDPTCISSYIYFRIVARIAWNMCRVIYNFIISYHILSYHISSNDFVLLSVCFWKWSDQKSSLIHQL